MHKTNQYELTRRIIYLGLAVIALMVLAAGLSNLELRPGEILFAPSEQRSIEVAENTGEATITPYMIVSRQSGLALAAVIFLAISVYAAHRSKEVRAGLITILVFVGLYMGIISLYRAFYEPPEQEEYDVLQKPAEPERLPADLLDNPPDVTDWISILTTGGIILTIGAAAWFFWRNRDRFLNRKPPLEIITDEVGAALADLRAGADLKDAVMRCYYDMGQSLRKGMGLVRQEGMTPREFEAVLEKAGLPSPAVQQLTRLFERVRYGRQAASERDTLEAVDCLEAIIQAAQGQMKEPVQN